MIKHITLVAAAVVAVGVTGSLSAQQYHQYQNKKKASQVQMVPKSQADAAVTAVKQSAAAEYQTLLNTTKQAENGCQTGAQAYALLSAPLKAKVSPTAPTCPAPVR